MLDSIKELIKMYADQVDNDMDLVLEFTDKLMESMSEFASILKEEIMDQLEDAGYFDEKDEKEKYS